jgi:hypothetical protein
MICTSFLRTTGGCREQAYKKGFDYFTGVWTFGVYTPKVQRICVV